MGSRVERTCGKAGLADPVSWRIVKQGGQSWPARQQLVDPVTDLATQGSSTGK